MKLTVIALFSLGALLATACTANPDSDADVVDDDAPLGSVQSALDSDTVSFNGWTATSKNITFTFGMGLSASAGFTGAGNFPHGVCLLKEHAPEKACNTDADCGNAPTTLPTGGYRYCTKPYGWAYKTCFFRPGSTQNFCAGTPKTGVPLPAGNLATYPGGSGAGYYVSYACLAGCTASDPSVARAYYFNGSSPPQGACGQQGC
jgi:hypothetical protein